MKHVKTLLAVALVTGLVFAFASPALAADESAYIYGEAVQHPAIEVNLDGVGGPGDVFYYEGDSNDGPVSEYYGNYLYLSNSGQTDVEMSLVNYSDPQDYGFDFWNFGSEAGHDTCVWEFENVYGSGWVDVADTEQSLGVLHMEDTMDMHTQFTFPTNLTSENTHYFQAIITAEEASII